MSKNKGKKSIQKKIEPEHVFFVTFFIVSSVVEIFSWQLKLKVVSLHPSVKQ